MEMDYTRKFSIQNDKDPEIKKILSSVYQSLQEKGYNPINQIVGYILSEDPTYITNYNNARALIRKLDRDELLQELVKQSPFFHIPQGLSIVFSGLDFDRAADLGGALYSIDRYFEGEQLFEEI